MCLLKLYKRTIFVRNNCIPILCVILRTTTENKMTGIRNFILIVLICMSISIKGECLNDKPTTMANEFLISKWKMYYKACDVNHDGKTNKEDVEELANRVSDLEHLDAERVKILTEAFSQYLNECIFLGRKEGLLEHEFVDSFKTDFNANVEEFAKEQHRCLNLIYSAIDINEDKSISEEEFLIEYAAFGNQQLDKEIGYDLPYKTKDGLVSLRFIVDSWVDLLTSTDQSKGNFV